MLRETTTAHWVNKLAYASNETGFTALASNRAKLLPEDDWQFGVWAGFWTSSGTRDIQYYAMITGEGGIFTYAHYGSSGRGYSIRCVKD